MASSLWLFFTSIFIARALAQGTPIACVWSENSYGPDGPWQAVSVQLGNPGQPIDLYPGSTWQSPILASSICDNRTTSTNCYAAEAGLYDASKSTTASSFTTGITENGVLDWTSGVMQFTGTGGWHFDTLSWSRVGFPGVEIPNLSLGLIEAAYETLPNGMTIMPEVGMLALGAPAINQTWSQGSNEPQFNGSILPNFLFEQGLIPSNSFGLHIGSTALKIPGSLYWGGYDQTRVLGTVTTQPYGTNYLQLDLLDIGLDVAEGHSPFDFGSKSGILASGNSSIGTSIPVRIDGSVPYLYLPRSTCDALAQDLPVTFDEGLGLYLWDQSKAQYTTIVSSPAIMQFSFRLNNGNSQNTTINLPFRLLNLTLDAPLVTTPTPYFPCRPISFGSYTLGRAFLQAAFLGANWNDQSPGNFWLAQAPGPNTASTAVLKTVQPTDGTVVASENSWLNSWKGSWTVLDSTSTNSTTGTNSGTTSSATSKGLSSGAIIGIGVGIGIPAALAIAALIWWLLRRRRQHSSQSSQEFHFKNELSGESSALAAARGSPVEIYSSREYPKETEGTSTAEPRELDDTPTSRRGERRTQIYELS